MKIGALALTLCLLLGCSSDDAPSGGARSSTREGPRAPDAGVSRPEDAAVAMDAEAPADAAQPRPRPMRDAAVPDARVATDAAGDTSDDPDAGVEPPDGAVPPRVDAGPPRDGMLRDLALNMTGMDDDLNHFAQFRISDARGDFHIMFVIHEGLPTPTYSWRLPNALFTGQSYTLDIFLDHDDTTGAGFFDEPPIDHAWSIPIPAGDGDVTIDFAHNDDFVDVEDRAPTPFNSLYLTSTDLGEYRNRLYDVRVIQRDNGRIVGRQVREIPGDTFELTVGSTLHAGIEYQIDVAVDADGNGSYNYPTDPSWRLMATGPDDDLRITLNATAAQVDVGF